LRPPFFADNSIKGRCIKALIAEVRRVLSHLPAYRVQRLRTGVSPASRRRDPIAYAFLSSAQRIVFLRIAGIYRARNAALSPPHLPPLGLVTLSVTERTLRMHSLGALHSETSLIVLREYFPSGFTLIRQAYQVDRL